jgi:hypothetical protein
MRHRCRRAVGGRLWALTYAPHMPKGSSDKLYEITPDLVQTVRPESIGGTPANRMIHRESGQLFIGPYAIDEKGKDPRHSLHRRCSAAPPQRPPSHRSGEQDLLRLDGGGPLRDRRPHPRRHPELYPRRGRTNPPVPRPICPATTARELYSGQGACSSMPTTAKTPQRSAPGSLYSLGRPRRVGRNGRLESRAPHPVHRGDRSRRHYGNENPATDPLWSIGWDAPSLILMLRDGGAWHTYRLPKASHSYDGAHGWNTEWPRIREIGEGDDLLMTMHGSFWRFRRASPSPILRHRPALELSQGHRATSAAGSDRLVFGCDDTAKSEFLNKRKAKGEIAAPASRSRISGSSNRRSSTSFGPSSDAERCG